MLNRELNWFGLMACRMIILIKVACRDDSHGQKVDISVRT